MSDINTVVLVGRLTQEPETKASGVVRFTLAVNRVSVKEGVKEDRASFLNCVAFGTTGKTLATYCHKGSRIGIEGHLQQNRWNDTEGKPRQSVEVNIHSFSFLDTKGEHADKSPAEQVKKEFDGEYEDSPF